MEIDWRLAIDDCGSAPRGQSPIPSSLRSCTREPRPIKYALCVRREHGILWARRGRGRAEWIRPDDPRKERLMCIIMLLLALLFGGNLLGMNFPQP